MIELKRCNYFTGDVRAVSTAVHSIVKFLEVDGRNAMLFTPPKPVSGSKQTITDMIYTISPKTIWSGTEDFRTKLEDKSNLFRITLLVFDFWSLGRTAIAEYKELIDTIGIDYIIVSSKYHYKDSDDIRVYKIEKESIDVGNNSLGSYHIPDYKYWITDKIGGWRSTIDDLIISYRRDKKIVDIFRKD